MTLNAEFEDFYPLSPMQEGMLFHTLYASSSGVYVTQVTLRLSGKLDLTAFEQVWQRLVDRYTILRTFFVWEKLDRPAQVVQRHVKVNIELQDWREVTPAEQQEKLQALLSADRKRGFNLSKPPLARFVLIRLEENSYEFVFSFHHLLLDGWSVPILLQEAITLYEAAREGREASLTSRRPYRDYISWLQRQDLAGAEAYWRRLLKGFYAPTPLAVDKTPQQGSVEATFSTRESFMSAQASDVLDSFARRNRLTLNTVLQGAWAMLLSRYSGEQDVLFGATVSGRPSDLPEVESMVGLFINTLPVRARVDPNCPVLRWLQEFQQQQIQARDYEYTPLVRIHEWSEVPRGVSLFESIFVCENYPSAGVSDATGDGLRVLSSQCEEQTNYPLSMMVTPGARFVLKVFYGCSRFEVATIERIMSHYETLLEAIGENPQKQIWQLPLLNSDERRQLLIEWNDTERESVGPRCMHELFEAQVARTPQHTALLYERQQLSYEDLNARANQLAHYLRRAGVGPDVLVGIMLERSLQMVVALLGVLKAGGAYVPLDPHYPAERLRYMMRDAGVELTITEECWADSVIGRVLKLDREAELIATESKSNVTSGVSPENLAYVIYTSGSTGQPKGTMLSHRGLSNLSDAQVETYCLTKDDRVLQFSSLSFDASIFEIVMPLRVGARLYLANPEAQLPGPELLRLLREEAITAITLPPSALAVLPFEELPNLKTITVAGEACPPDLVNRWAAQRRFFNAYGPTEATVWSTIDECDTSEAKPTIGRPIRNTQIHLLDEHLEPVPVGVPGELHIGGVGLARGYLNRPDITALRFIPNPFSTEPGARLYRSADLARFLPEGKIDFLGRMDDQVKIRGFRVELGEIEATLASHPAVRECVVVVREDTPKEKRLVGYIVFGGLTDAIKTNELISYLRNYLPDYMVPATFVILDALPLMPNGKVNRKALPIPQDSRPELEVSFVPPRTETEKRVAAIWQQALQISNIGVNDNFFDLGGHSLLMIQINGKLRAAFGRDIPLVDLFQYPTIMSLARQLEESKSSPVSFQEIQSRAQKQKDAINRQRQSAAQRK